MRSQSAQVCPLNTVEKWLKAPGEVVPKYERASAEGKLTAFEPPLQQALTTDSHRPNQGRRSGRALFAQIRAQGYRGGYSAVAACIRRWRVGLHPARPRLSCP